MITNYKINDYNLRDNLKNIRDFNYLGFSDEQWLKVGARFNKRLPKGYNKAPYQLDIEATKVNPIIKMFFKSLTSEDYVCVKVTPYEVMVAVNSDDIFKYSKMITRDWHAILQDAFGESYEQAKNKHYGIKAIEK